MRKKIIKAIMIILIVCVSLTMFIARKNDDKSSGILSMFEEYKGYTRVITQEEYDFYEYFVKRDLSENVNDEELERKVKSYANKINAAFYLGNQLGLCEPYSFEALQLRMEQENSSRQVKLAQGEVIYGLEQFDLQTYFQYTLDNLEASLKGYLEENADDEILKMAETYYEAHEEEFRNRVEVVYEEIIGNTIETVTADADMISYIGKADPGLADFLGIAETGDVYEDEKDYQKRKIILKEITYNEDGFENHADLALYRFVRNELYDQIITKVAENNPLEFE